MAVPIKLTQRTIAAAKTSGSSLFVWDSDLQGFGLRVTRAGVKSFVVQYRAGYGRNAPTRRMTIGRYGSPWTLDAARKEARLLLARAAQGGDPAKARQSESREMTFAEFCDVYFAEGCTTKKADTIRYDRSRIEGHVKPILGRSKLGKISRTDIERLMRAIAEGRTATKLKAKSRGRSNFKGGKTAATRTIGLLQGMFTFAEARGLVASNPTRGVQRYADTKRERFLSGSEMAALGSALREMQDEGRNQNGIDVIRLLALSGARRAEIERMRWDEIDLDRAIVRLKDSKTGAKTFPLAPAALQLLANRKLGASTAFVFPAARGEGPFNGTGKIWREARARAGLEGVRIHDLRHTFASFGASSGFGLPVIGAILGHSQATTTQRYAHLANDPVLQAATRIGDEIAGYLGAAAR